MEHLDLCQNLRPGGKSSKQNGSIRITQVVDNQQSRARGRKMLQPGNRRVCQDPKDKARQQVDKTPKNTPPLVKYRQACKVRAPDASDGFGGTASVVIPFKD
jgi:hypothetical protein